MNFNKHNIINAAQWFEENSIGLAQNFIYNFVVGQLWIIQICMNLLLFILKLALRKSNHGERNNLAEAMAFLHVGVE